MKFIKAESRIDFKPGLFCVEQSKSEHCFIFLHQFIFFRIYQHVRNTLQSNVAA